MANSADPGQTPRSVASDQGLYCLLKFSVSQHLGQLHNTTHQEPRVPSKHGKGNGIPIKYFTTLSSIEIVLGKS